MPSRRFEATHATITKDLLSTVRKMGATNLQVRMTDEVMKGTGTSEILFDRGGRRYTFRCVKYAEPLDNLRAAQLTMSLLWRALEEYGTIKTEAQLAHEFTRMFMAFEALPDDTTLLLTNGASKWWELLNVRKDAPKADIVGAFRALARQHHPDMGGNAEDFKRLRRAYEEAMETVGGKP